MRRSLIKSAGGVRRLIQLLDPAKKDDEGSGAGGDQAKRDGKGMWKLVSTVVAVVEDGLTSGGEVGQARIIDVGVQTAAAAALSDLAKGDEDMQDTIIQEGGVTPLLSLMRTGSPIAQEHAARAIWALSATTDNQDIIVANDAIPDLVGLIRDGSTAAQEVGAAVLSELAQGAVKAKDAEKLDRAVKRRRNSQSQARRCRRAASSSPSRRAAPSAPSSEPPPRRGRRCGGRRRLLLQPARRHRQRGRDHPAGDAHRQRLRDGGKERAAGALWHLSMDSSNQQAIAKAGGIAPLVQLLDDGTEQATEWASEALKRLADSSNENQAQIAKKLVGLLSSQSETAHTRAANALWELASNNADSPTVIVNAGAISPLVTLLSSGASEAKDAAKAALQMLALNNPSNQLAIATGLVALLGQGSAEAQEHVTDLLLTLASDATNRVAISKAGAIPRLISQPAAGGGHTSTKARSSPRPCWRRSGDSRRTSPRSPRRTAYARSSRCCARRAGRRRRTRRPSSPT